MDTQAQAVSKTPSTVGKGADDAKSPARVGLSIQKAKETLEQFRQVCINPDAGAEVLDSLAGTLQDAGFRHEMTDIIMGALSDPAANPQLGVLWIRRLTSSSAWDRTYPKYLDGLVKRGEIGRRAVIELAKYLTTKRRPKVVKQLLRKHSGILKQDPLGRELIAEALAKGGCYHQVLSWTASRDNEAEVGTNVLFARALAYRGVGKERKSAPLIDKALERGAGQQYPLLHIWKAMDLAFSGNTAEARKHIESVQAAGWEDDVFCMYYLVRGVIRVQETPKGEKKEAFHAAVSRIRSRFHKFRAHQRQWMVRRVYRRCMCRMAMDSGVWWRGVIAPWKSADSAFMILPLAIVPGLQVVLPIYLYRLLTHRNAPSR